LWQNKILQYLLIVLDEIQYNILQYTIIVSRVLAGEGYNNTRCREFVEEVCSCRNLLPFQVLAETLIIKE
jgi:hypothetical protein